MELIVGMGVELIGFPTASNSYPSLRRLVPSSSESTCEERHLSTSSDPDTTTREESPPSSSTLLLGASFDEDIIDLK